MDRFVRLNAGLQRVEAQLLSFVQLMLGKAASGGGRLIKIVVGGSGLLIRIVISGSGRVLDVAASGSARAVSSARLSSVQLVGTIVNLFEVWRNCGAHLYEQACFRGFELVSRIVTLGDTLTADGEVLLERAIARGTHVYQNASTGGGQMISQATTRVGATGSQVVQVFASGGSRLVRQVTYLLQRAATIGRGQSMSLLTPFLWAYGLLREMAERCEQEITGIASPAAMDTRGWQMQVVKELRLLSVACGIPKNGGACPVLGQCGADAWFATSTARGETLGVAKADGGKIGRICNLSPGEFSSALMRSCEHLAQKTSHDPRRLDLLLHRAHCDVLDVRHPLLSTCSTCVLSLDRRTGSVYATNIGGCGYMVVRNGQIVARSTKQLQVLKAPLQGVCAFAYGDFYQAPIQELYVEVGDMLLLGTDGFFDNVDNKCVLALITELEGGTDPHCMHLYAETLTLMARAAAKRAVRNGVRRLKADDITIVLAVVH